MARVPAERCDGLRRYRTEVRRESRMAFAAYLQKVAVDLRLPVSCEARTVARWEDGDVRWPQELYRRLLTVATGCELADLGFAPNSLGRLHEADAVDTGAPPTPAPAADWLDVHRRTLLAGVAAGLAVLSGRLPPDEHRDRALGELGTNPHRVDADTADDIKAIALRYRRSYRSMSPTTLMPHAFGHLQLVVELRPESQTSTIRRTLVSTIAEMAALIGTMWSLDRQEFAIGEQYLQLAARAAAEAEDRDLIAFVLGGRAFHEAYSGDLAAGLHCIENAQAMAARGASATNRGWLAAVASELHASAGMERECRNLLEAAAHHLSATDEGPWVGVGAFDSAKLRAYHGGAYRRLGRYREAEAELTEALDELAPSMLKHRCTALIDLAETHVLARDADRAATRALDALALAQRTGHEASIRRIRVVHQDLRAYSEHSAATRQFRDALQPQ